MKNNFLTFLGLAAVSVIAITSCTEKKLTEDKAKTKLQKAQEKIDAANGYTVVADSSSALTFTVSVSGQQVPVSTGLDAKADIKAGVLFNEDKTNVSKAYAEGNASAKVYAHNEKEEESDGFKAYVVNGLFYKKTTHNNLPSGKSKTTLSQNELTDVQENVNTYIPGVNSECKFNVETLVGSLADSYGHCEITQNGEDITYLFSLDEAEVKAYLQTKFTKIENDENSSVLANCLAQLSVNECYVKFTFNERATKLIMETKIDAVAHASVAFGGFVGADLRATASANAKINLADTLSDEYFPSSEEIANW